MSRDPRFDDLSGRFNESMFEKAYSFLNDIRSQERQVNKYFVLPDRSFYASRHFLTVVFVILV